MHKADISNINIFWCFNNNYRVHLPSEQAF